MTQYPCFYCGKLFVPWPEAWAKWEQEYVTEFCSIECKRKFFDDADNVRIATGTVCVGNFTNTNFLP